MSPIGLFARGRLRLVLAIGTLFMSFAERPAAEALLDAAVADFMRAGAVEEAAAAQAYLYGLAAAVTWTDVVEAAEIVGAAAARLRTRGSGYAPFAFVSEALLRVIAGDLWSAHRALEEFDAWDGPVPDFVPFIAQYVRLMIRMITFGADATFDTDAERITDGLDRYAPELAGTMTLTIAGVLADRRDYARARRWNARARQAPVPLPADPLGRQLLDARLLIITGHADDGAAKGLSAVEGMREAGYGRAAEIALARIARSLSDAGEDARAAELRRGGIGRARPSPERLGGAAARHRGPHRTLDTARCPAPNGSHLRARARRRRRVRRPARAARTVARAHRRFPARGEPAVHARRDARRGVARHRARCGATPARDGIAPSARRDPRRGRAGRAGARRLAAGGCGTRTAPRTSPSSSPSTPPIRSRRAAAVLRYDGDFARAPARVRRVGRRRPSVAAGPVRPARDPRPRAHARNGRRFAAAGGSRGRDPCPGRGRGRPRPGARGRPRVCSAPAGPPRRARCSTQLRPPACSPRPTSRPCGRPRCDEEVIAAPYLRRRRRSGVARREVHVTTTVGTEAARSGGRRSGRWLLLATAFSAVVVAMLHLRLGSRRRRRVPRRLPGRSRLGARHHPLRRSSSSSTPIRTCRPPASLLSFSQLVTALGDPALRNLDTDVDGTPDLQWNLELGALDLTQTNFVPLWQRLGGALDATNTVHRDPLVVRSARRRPQRCAVPRARRAPCSISSPRIPNDPDAPPTHRHDERDDSATTRDPTPPTPPTHMDMTVVLQDAPAVAARHRLPRRAARGAVPGRRRSDRRAGHPGSEPPLSTFVQVGSFARVDDLLDLKIDWDRMPAQFAFVDATTCTGPTPNRTFAWDDRDEQAGVADDTSRRRAPTSTCTSARAHGVAGKPEFHLDGRVESLPEEMTGTLTESNIRLFHQQHPGGASPYSSPPPDLTVDELLVTRGGDAARRDRHAPARDRIRARPAGDDERRRDCAMHWAVSRKPICGSATTRGDRTSATTPSARSVRSDSSRQTCSPTTRQDSRRSR